MKIGASTIMHRDRPLSRELFQEYQEAGIDSLELTDYHPGFFFTDLDAFASLRQAMTDLSLHLNTLHIHLEIFDDYDLATLDDALREKSLTAYRQAVDVMEALGGGILVTHHIQIPEPEDGSHDAKRQAYIDNLGAVASYAAPKDVSFAVARICHILYPSDTSSVMVFSFCFSAENISLLELRISVTGGLRAILFSSNDLISSSQNLWSLHDNFGKKRSSEFIS